MSSLRLAERKAAGDEVSGADLIGNFSASLDCPEDSPAGMVDKQLGAAELVLKSDGRFFMKSGDCWVVDENEGTFSVLGDKVTLRFSSPKRSTEVIYDAWIVNKDMLLAPGPDGSRTFARN